MELIKIVKNQNGGNVVSARELYKFLEYDDSKFTRYATSKITNNEFAVEGVDYQRLDISVDMPNGATRTIYDYVLTINFAKKLAMIANTDKGNEVRDYFIECENKLKAQFEIPQTFAQALKLAAEQAEQIELKSKQLELQEPKVEYYDNVLQSGSAIAINNIAKELGLSAIALNKKLHDLKVQYKQSGTWVLYSKYQDLNYTKTKTYTHTSRDGEPVTTIKTYWTELGREFIHELIKNN